MANKLYRLALVDPDSTLCKEFFLYGLSDEVSDEFLEENSCILLGIKQLRNIQTDESFSKILRDAIAEREGVKVEIEVRNNQPAHTFPDELRAKLTKLENNVFYDMGLKGKSGGFALAQVTGYDAEYYDIELTWGVQNDEENTVHTETFKIDIKTFEIKEA